MTALTRDGDVFVLDLGETENRFSPDSLAAIEDAGLTLADIRGAVQATNVNQPKGALFGNQRNYCVALVTLDESKVGAMSCNPAIGGLATTLMVTMELEQLVTGLGVARLGTGEPITAGEARRLACTAALVPAVLGSKSEVLDLGRWALVLVRRSPGPAGRGQACRISVAV